MARIAEDLRRLCGRIRAIESRGGGHVLMQGKGFRCSTQSSPRLASKVE
jgi:hypothetical protein